MITIDWHPDRRALRKWGVTMAVAMAAAGSLFRFVDWGVFRAGQGLAPYMWGFGLAALVTAGTGSRLGRPVYLAWMGFAWCIIYIILWNLYLMILMKPLCILLDLMKV